MKIAVFSDVHRSLPALEFFVAATRSAVDAYLCLGDVVNYGPWNDECLNIVLNLPHITLLEGNQERLFLGTAELMQEPPLVQTFYRHSHKCFMQNDLIAGLPETCRLGEFECRHTINGRKVYPDTLIEVACDHLIGHSHHQ
jgi:predicted phosphodiesterase